MRSLRRDRRAGAVAAAWLALSLAARSTSAADTEPIRVRFEAPGGCPGEAAFLDQVRARTVKARVAAPGEKARTFAVQLTQEGRSIRGRLAIEEPSMPTGIREVTSERCGEVVSALALITALAVDPHASTAPPARLPAAPAPVISAGLPPGSGGVAPVGSSLPAAPPRAWLPPSYPAPYIVPRSWAALGVAPRRMIPRLAEETWRFSVGIQATAISGIGAPLSPGAALLFEAALEDQEVFAFAPSLRLAAIEANSGYVGSSPIMARFRLRIARAEVCPLRVRIFSRASIAPCGTFEAGALFAEGWSSGETGWGVRPWAASGLGGHLRAAITSDIDLQVEGGGAFPLIRDTFFLAPEVDVHTVPAATGWIAAGMSVRFF